MLRLDRSPPRPRLLVGGPAPVAVTQVAALVAPAGQVTPLPVDTADPCDDGVTLHGAVGGMRARSRWRVEDDVVAVELELRYDGEDDLEAGVRFALDLPGRAMEPNWMVPGCFYRHNRFA